MTIRYLCLLCLTTGLALGGCGVVEQATNASATDLPHDRFINKTQRDAGPGSLVVQSVESTEETHWYHAMAAMSLIEGGTCPDGAPFSISYHRPELEPGGGTPGSDRRYPKGTVFERGIECRPVFRDQAMLPAETTTLEGVRILTEALGGPGEFDNDRFAATEVPFNDRNPKYSAIMEMLGSMLEATRTFCRGGGVEIKRRLIYSKPTPAPEAGVFLNASSAFVGIEYACSDGLAADRSL